jgi:hypothetical protein
VRKWIFYTFTIILTYSTIGFTNTTVYNLSDLEILEKEKNTLEFLEHARDIKPSLRGVHYQEMLENMGILHLKRLLSKKSFKKRDFNFIEKISEWPTLKKDAFYQSKRNTYMQNYFEVCFSRSQFKEENACEDQLLSFWFNSNNDPDLGIHFATLLSKKHGHLNDYWTFINAAALSKVSEYLCKKDIVLQFSQVRISYLDSKYKTDDIKFLRSVDKSMNLDCLNQLYPGLISVYKKSKVENKGPFFRLLRLHRQLSMKDINVYFTELFLSAPSPSREFNLAWNTITKLGQDFQARQQVLKSLSEKNLLPGKLFNTNRDKKSKTILNLLHQNFPEYIDLYSKTCLSYMAGDKVYPYGNPTPYCQKLFKTHASLLDKGHLIRFEEVLLK